MSSKTIDYRNGIYQGYTDHLERRNGLGILIDDELTLYASFWKENKLNGPTLLYLSHGKYVYGQWSNN